MDITITALTGWLLIQYLFITLGIAAFAFLLANRWIDIFISITFIIIVVVARRRYKGGSVREPLITFERDMDCKFLSIILPSYFISILLYCLTIALLRN